MPFRHFNACAAPAALAAALLSACVTPATEVMVVLDTNVPADRLMVISATVRPSSGADAGGSHLWSRGGIDSVSLPATFAITPHTAPNDTAVLLDVRAQVERGANGEPAFVIHRTARFRFTPHQTTLLTVFLDANCGSIAVGCTMTEPNGCSIGALCDESGLTCGNSGQCVPVDVTPVATDGGVSIPPHDASEAMTADVSSDTATDVSTDSGVHGRRVFTLIGGLSGWVAPAGVSLIQIKMWGAGGGSMGSCRGGGGGFASTSLAVTSTDQFSVVVGGTAHMAAGGAQGGAYAGTNCGPNVGAGGGGYSVVWRDTTTIAAAGGGGGAGFSMGACLGGGGGGGGGLMGGSSGPVMTGFGGGATAMMGGLGGTGQGGGVDGHDGMMNQGGVGGTGTACGGGGGGGVFGGGGGGGSIGTLEAYGGGGGAGTAIGLSPVIMAGSIGVPGNPDDPDRGTAGSFDTDGVVIISW